MLEKLIGITQNKMMKQSFITLFLRVLGVLTLFGFTIFFNRFFPTNIVGDYEFTRMFLLVTGGFCLIGTDISILYFSGKFKSDNKFYLIKTLYYKILKLTFGFCVVLTIIYFLFFNKISVNKIFGSENSYTIISWCILFLVFNVWTLFNTEVLRALDQIVWSELFRNTFKFFPIFLGSFLLYNSKNQADILYFYILGFVLLSFLSGLFVIILLNKIDTPTSLNYNINYREIIKYSFPMGVSSLIMYLLSTIDIVLLRNYFSSSDVAFYALAIKLMTILSMIILSININVSPQIAELYLKNDFDQLKNVLKKSSRIIFGLSIIVGIGILVFNNTILSLFGHEYLASKKALFILITGQIIVSALGSVSVYLNMTGRPQIFRTILFLSLGINLVFNFILIPKYGILGAAITYVLTMLFWNLSAVFYIYKKDKIMTFIH